MSLVASAIEHIGLKPIADRYGFELSAIHKWKKQGRLPKTDLAGLTDYAATIEQLSGGKYRAAQLLAETRQAWQRSRARPGKRKRAN